MQVDKVDVQLRSADVIVLVYDVNNELSTTRVSSHWLPKFRAAQLNVPVILVGNKIDVRGGIADPTAAAKMEEFIKPIMDHFREVDVCIECSAKTVSNISEVFYFAQKAVLYPTGQVYDVDTHCLKPDASTALRRIFKLCDKDADGGLNDKELNDFQYHCFNVYLKEDELEGVKKVVRESCPRNGINADGSLSEEGFIFLHTLFVQKGRLETTWIVLRKFGYDDNMRLELDASEIPTCNDDQTIELSAEGKSFLGNLFAAADSDADGMLSPTELRKLFAACPDGQFAVRKKILGERLTKRCDETGKEGYMTLEAFMARWTMYVMDSVEDCLLSFRYLGYNDEKSALKVTKGKRRDRYNRALSKDVVRVAVLGSDGHLKTDIVRGLVGMDAGGADGGHVMSSADVTYVERDANDVSCEVSKTVVLRQVPEESMSDLFASRSELESTDVMCIVFDAGVADSLEKARLIWQAVDAKKGAVKVPFVLVACVTGDIMDTGSEVLDRADKMCVERDLPTPTRVSVQDGEFGSLYADLLGVALHPEVICQDYYDGVTDRRSSLVTAAKWAAVAVIGGAVIYAGKRAYEYYSKKTT
eukprot:TRINITY_DN1765_c0_g1_i1.p1 TRINITY_DN1765_c0_g1~~TRINITY_DN1765_c0_g1_i1.p1  ORF type:complete len:588 (+),score=131.21 TRINITY_DN1765_c0_g1_i1:322-2085(+)